MSSPPRLVFRVSLLNHCSTKKCSFVSVSHPFEPKSYVVGFRNHEWMNEIVPYLSLSESIRMETNEDSSMMGSLNPTRLIMSKQRCPPKIKKSVIHPYSLVPMDLENVIQVSSKIVFGLDLIEETSTEWHMDGLFIEL